MILCVGVEQNMTYPKELKMAHNQVQKNIFKMIPEKWEKIFLYASIIDHFKQLQTGEMFFYYYPRGLLKKKAINIYEIPEKFNIDESHYSKLANELYESIEECTANNEKPWTNITIAIEKQKYTAEFGYEKINASENDINEKHVIWTYKYLNLPLDYFNKKEREIIKKYINSPKVETKTFEMPLYTKENNRQIRRLHQTNKKLKFVTEEKIKEMEYIKTHKPKSQILK